MVSVASGGTADRIAARILFKVLRAGSGTPARYSSTFFGAPSPFGAELRLPDFTFFMRAMLRELPLQVHAPDHVSRSTPLTALNATAHTRGQHRFGVPSRKYFDCCRRGQLSLTDRWRQQYSEHSKGLASVA